uniref:Retrotransposon protein, putative, Ty1-copia subclass n=1 Tax=Tanacetum cinerariifolium TaxID=118510 RepID=A0A6L2MV30_TANCI|nr:retrotransposon protein, putative, Ty1-copia subclass [Tanacetum cinerariifolium]
MFEKQAGVERFDLIQTLHACKQEEGKPVGACVLKMKDYAEQLEHLGYVLPQDLSVGLILNALTSDFAGFVRSYNMHNMRKTIGEIHALLIEYEKGFPKKAETAQVMMIKSGKMTRKSFPHLPKRATDLFGIIHTDVCGPLRHVSRQGTSYFITFTDDYSHYGYVYLLKHKHKVFETFKVFKNEVGNQLGKTIKALRSDRGAECISQEFNDYLKACGIVQQLTPPYTPQHNDVFERRNRYPKETMGYYFYFLPENNFFVARYTKFFEKSLINQEVSGRAIDVEEIQDEDTSPFEITSKIPMEVEGFEPPHEEEILIRRSERSHRVPNHLCLNVEAEEHSLGDLNEPTSYKAAMLDPESNKWLDAMNVEMQSMIDNKVWVLVDLPPNCKIVRSKWIFKKKTDIDGIVYTYKARLVAKGYTQLYDVDYEETFSPIADIRAIRILISIAVFYDYEIWKMDVKTAFLNGYLDEDIYMVQPEGFVDPKHPIKLCKIQRSIYGLKQASRSWNKRLDEEIKKFGFAQNLDEPCVYQKASESNVTFLILYVDDIIIMGNHIPSLQSVKDYLEKCFAMKDLGEAAFILRIKIYIDRCTRPDVAFAQNITSHFQHNTGECQWTAVKNILKYLRNTKDMFLVYGENPEAELRVDCYCAVDWKSSKQSTTAMSATEAEYIASSEAAMEAIWIRKFISGLGIVPKISEPINMFCEYSATLLIANKPRIQRGARHYHRRYHYVRKCIELSEINLLKVNTDDNLADPFTKALPKGKLTQHARGIGLHLASSFMQICVLVFG